MTHDDSRATHVPREQAGADAVAAVAAGAVGADGEATPGDEHAGAAASAASLAGWIMGASPFSVSDVSGLPCLVRRARPLGGWGVL